MYKISIVIPVFNVEDYLERSFDSILNQTFGFDNLEVIFVDDCSTDKSFRTEKNSGYAGEPRNIGIENATAPFLMFLDPDDEYLENACEFLYDEIIKEDLNFVSANFIHYKNNELRLFDWRAYFNDIKPGDRIFLDNPKQDINIFKVSASIWTKIFKREFILNNSIRFPVGIAAQDLIFVVKSLTKTENILYINKPVAKYNVREDGSVTTELSKKSLASYITAYKLFRDIIAEYDESYSWLASRSLVSFWHYKLINSKISDSDKVDLLKYAEPLFEDLKNTDQIKINFKQKVFFDCCCEKRYYDAIDLSRKLYYKKDNYSRDETLENLKVFFIFDDLNAEKLNKFNDAFEDVIFITDHDLDSKINHINLNEYYDDFAVMDGGQVILNKADPDLSLNFDNVNDFYIYAIEEITSDEDNPVLINYINDFNVNININNINSNKIAILDLNDMNEEFYKNYLSGFDAVILANDIGWFEFKNFKIMDDLFSSEKWDELLFEILSKIDFNYNYNILKTTKQNKNLILENRNLKKENKELKELKESLLNSSSWKITAPIRKIKKLR